MLVMWGPGGASGPGTPAPSGSEDIPDPVQQPRQRRSDQAFAIGAIDCSTSARSPA